ncbi:MAG: hypothetical protein DMF63_15690 [Acidobacteria bacterium]|nr:MAG: hypothetical protein DMF63_15690 [Acidobacteriota bacterium]
MENFHLVYLVYAVWRQKAETLLPAKYAKRYEKNLCPRITLIDTNEFKFFHSRIFALFAGSLLYFSRPFAYFAGTFLLTSQSPNCFLGIK